MGNGKRSGEREESGLLRGFHLVVEALAEGHAGAVEAVAGSYVDLPAGLVAAGGPAAGVQKVLKSRRLNSYSCHDGNFGKVLL